ncbi:MAG: glutaredoxin [Chromatiales bacterium]|nr:glutaredoxin [Chromatiales bacterium]
MPARIEIFSTSFCRHCVAAREFLDARNIEYVDNRLDLMPLERDEMIRRCGLKSVPQIFIDGRHVGGYEQLVALQNSGDLDRLLGKRSQI